MLGDGGPGCAEGLASALRGWLQGWHLERVCVAHGQALGAAGVLQRVWKGLTPCPWVFALLGAQMVAVNASSPTAACSGPWDARGMEESVTTSDGNAESLYMQGTGREVASSSPGVGQDSGERRRPGPGHFSRRCFATHFPLPAPKPLLLGFQPLLGRGQCGNKSDLNDGL